MEPEPAPSYELSTTRVGSRYRQLAHPVVAMLAIAALFHVLWGKPIDGVVTLLVALVAARATTDRRPVEAVAIRMEWPVVVVVALLYGIVVGGWSRFSWPTTIAVFLPGIVLLAVADRAPPRAVVPTDDISTAGRRLWAAAWLVLCGWEVIAFSYQPSRKITSYDHPTLSAMMNSVLAHHPGRAITLATWLACGWALARR